MILAVVVTSIAVLAIAGGVFLIMGQSSGEDKGDSALPRVWPSNGGTEVRDVPMPRGEMLALLPKQTTGHVLCQAVDEQRWSTILDGKVLREVRGNSCHAVSAAFDAQVSVRSTSVSQLNRHRAVRISGRSGSVSQPVPGRVELYAPFTDSVQSPDPHMRKASRFALAIAVSVRDESIAPPIQRAAVRLAEAIQDAATSETPTIPQPDPDGSIAMKRLDHTPERGIVDAPWPVVSWQLCTALTTALNADVSRASPMRQGECVVRLDAFTVRATYGTPSNSVTGYPDVAGGKPAQLAPRRAIVKMVEHSRRVLTLAVDGKLPRNVSADTLADQVVPDLLGT